MARMCYTQLLKLCTHGQEALVHKGGLLVAAWKRKGPQNQCASYRSLLLQEAFYRVLRPLAISGPISDALLASVAQRLRLPDDAIHDLHCLLQLPSATDSAGLPLHMQRALQALHTNMHFHMWGQMDITHTKIGSRPGDPFADVVFGYMFSRLLTEVERRLVALDLLEMYEGPSTTGLDLSSTHGQPIVQQPLLGPTWMDDLCIPSHQTLHGALSAKLGSQRAFFLKCVHTMV